MASRRRQTRHVGGVLRDSPIFLPVRLGGSSAGRTRWRSRTARDLLRPVPPGVNDPEAWRVATRPRDVLRPGRLRPGRIAPTSTVVRGTTRPAVRVRVYGPVITLGKPVLNSRSTPCKRRAERREVMFARDVAGRKWGSGAGPKMRDWKFSRDSQYKCVR